MWHYLQAWWHAVVLGFRDWKRKYSTKVAYAIMDSAAPAPARVLPNPHLHLTTADRLDWLCRLRAGTYTIHRFGDGVIVTITLADMNVTSSGLQLTVPAAVSALWEKLA